jgi:hypothetical protein
MRRMKSLLAQVPRTQPRTPNPCWLSRKHYKCRIGARGHPKPHVNCFSRSRVYSRIGRTHIPGGASATHVTPGRWGAVIFGIMVLQPSRLISDPDLCVSAPDDRTRVEGGAARGVCVLKASAPRPILASCRRVVR